MASKRKGKNPAKKKSAGKKPTTTNPTAGAPKPRMDADHATMISDAEKAIKLAEKRLKIATADKKNATESYNTSVDRLRKLAEEVSDPGLWTPKDKA